MMTATSLRLSTLLSKRKKRYSLLLPSDSASFLFYFIYIFPSTPHNSLYSTRCPDPFFHPSERIAHSQRQPTGFYQFSLYWTRSMPSYHPYWSECIFPPSSSFLFVERERERATIALNHLGSLSLSNEENTILCVLGMHITRRSRVCMIGHGDRADFWRQ